MILDGPVDESRNLPGDPAPGPRRLNGAPQDDAWHSAPLEAVLTRLRASATGLSVDDASQRLVTDGPNQLKAAARISPVTILIGQFKSLIIWILVSAGVLAGLLGEAMDAIAILAIVVLNAAIGFYQELGAARSIAALEKMTAPRAKVLRGQRVTEINARGVVAGDVLVLEAGEVVAADARLLTAASLRCTESALTGESDAVSKRADAVLKSDASLGDRENMVFMGTNVAAGTGQAVVVATAMATELGRIAGLIDEAEADRGTPLQRKLDAFGKVLVWAALGIVALLFGLGYQRGTELLELAMTAVSLAVAAVPEGLPAVVTVALSVGVLRMARRRVLVRRLAAVETLGSTGVICTDKTGTLTVGEMTARVLYVAGKRYELSGDGYGPDGAVRFEGKATQGRDAAPLLELATAILACNNAQIVQKAGVWTTVGDPTEGALLVAGAKAGGDRGRIDAELPVRHTLPFDSDRKRSTVVRQMRDGTLRAFVNGAPGALLERCAALYTEQGTRPLTDQDRTEILALTSDLADSALRVIGSAWRDLGEVPPTNLEADAVERDLVFVGLTGMYDPPRSEAKAAIAKCRAAGIRVVMITGDHPRTAVALGRELGIANGPAAVTGPELEGMTDEELRRRASDIAVYARVTADHKLRIVRALKATGAVVAMTGDGVNDAPAISGADIGIAMGKSGTEVTRQAADMIITDDNFATIVAAVEEGRGIYDNIRKTLQYLLAGNTGELLLMTACVAANLPSPLLPIHLLWINLVTDGLPALCLATDPIDPGVMNRAPRPRSEPITDRRFLRSVAFTGVLTAGVALGVYVFASSSGTTEARTSVFGVLVFAELLRSFGARSDTTPVWRISPFTNVSLLVVVAVSVGIQIWSQHSTTLGGWLRTSTLPLADSLMLVAVGTIPLLCLEVVKAVRRARQRRAAPAP